MIQWKEKIQTNNGNKERMKELNNQLRNNKDNNNERNNKQTCQNLMLKDDQRKWR